MVTWRGRPQTPDSAHVEPPRSASFAGMQSAPQQHSAREKNWPLRSKATVTRKLNIRPSCSSSNLANSTCRPCPPACHPERPAAHGRRARRRTNLSATKSPMWSGGAGVSVLPAVCPAPTFIIASTGSTSTISLSRFDPLSMVCRRITHMCLDSLALVVDQGSETSECMRRIRIYKKVSQTTALL
jgi:hypothetical protein